MTDRSPNPKPGTIGHLEEQAGIGSSHAERFAFWLRFAPLKGRAYPAAVAELERLARDRASAQGAAA